MELERAAVSALRGPWAVPIWGAQKTLDLGYHLIEVTPEKVSVFVSERTKVSMYDTKAAGLLK